MNELTTPQTIFLGFLFTMAIIGIIYKNRNKDE